ncbi:MAG TPA: AbrB family transcriptional regulator [Leptolyngbyaceae cyanobacterium M33_DOE_097]|uniref:AbrB family transcriptional regulator n=1 Tax=Oscillatoriales cyanobacterium SpSt-418 TaxID=2282169 RepID=A0A7C3PBC7_9CYAN|nr:AbrB family transcriptional regulator [Leptolyngbyaceae cyanobacterium M33_DOE_097]
MSAIQASIRFHPSLKYTFIATELAIASVVGIVLTALGLGGAAWILGGMVAGTITTIVYRFSQKHSIQPNRKARKVGQAIVGLAIGLSLQQSYLGTIVAHAPALIGLPFYLMIGSGLIGLLYSRLEKTDLLTALLATTPGNISVMPSLAADYGKNPALVSLVQLLRFTSVICIMPMIANLTLAHPSTNRLVTFFSQLQTISLRDTLLSILMLLITGAVVYWGRFLKIPILAFLGAIAVGLAADSLPLLLPVLGPDDLQLPLVFKLVGQVLLGITIGEYWGISSPLKWGSVIRAFVPVSLMFGITLIAASLIQRMTDWNWLTCLLLAAPGGSPEMIWIAVTLGQDEEVITAGHLLRLILINFSLPFLVALGSTLGYQKLGSAVEPAE